MLNGKLCRLEKELETKDLLIFAKYLETRKEIPEFLNKYMINFTEFTDHSIYHYVLLMACLLHDIGMSIPIDRVKELIGTEKYIEYFRLNPDKSNGDLIRDYHHELSHSLIIKEFQTLKIPT